MFYIQCYLSSIRNIPKHEIVNIDVDHATYNDFRKRFYNNLRSTRSYAKKRKLMNSLSAQVMKKDTDADDQNSTETQMVVDGTILDLENWPPRDHGYAGSEFDKSVAHVLNQLSKDN